MFNGPLAAREFWSHPGVPLTLEIPVADAALIMSVRFKSALPFTELMGIAKERADAFRALPGLLQKYYVENPVSGDVGGIYVWDSQASLDEYRESDLRRSIGEAYQVIGDPTVEVLRVAMPLRGGTD